MNERYSRQILFSPIGETGQIKIRKKHVLLLGAGALGTGNAEALVRAGIGQLTVIDRDYVEWSNLQRQNLYTEHDARDRLPKAVAAKKRLGDVNSEVKINAHVMDALPSDMEHLLEGVDLMIDATDNFDARMMMNDLSQKYQIPWIYGACVSSYGISYTILPGETPCLNCLLDQVPLGGATCDTAGIISPAVQMVVAHQTAEAMKILVEDWSAVSRKLVSFDLWQNQHTSINVSGIKNATCPSCGADPAYPFLEYGQQMKTAVLCGREAVQIRPPENRECNLEEVAQTLVKQKGRVERNPYLVSFTKENKRMVLFKDGRALIHGTNDTTEAKSLYHRYFG